MALEFLRKIGLSEGEIKVYSALLNEGLSPVNRIHEKTGIERRNIYDILNKLIEKGVISYIVENKRRLFQVSHPSKLVGYIEERKNELEETKKETELQIPSILQKFNFKKPKINAEIFRGEEGVKAVWEDMLNYKVIRFIGSGRYVPKKFPGWFVSFNKRRIKKGVLWLNLMRCEMKKEIKKSFPLEKIKYLPKEFSVNPVAICIFGDKVINFLLGKEFFAFVIESKELAENYKKYYRYLWDKLGEP